jgi:hypothetical protein
MSVRVGRSPRRTGEFVEGPSLLMPLVPYCFHSLPQNWTVAWPSLGSAREGTRTLLAAEGSCRAQTALIKCLNGQAWAVPRWSVADIVLALWGFQDDPDTHTEGQPGMRIKQMRNHILCVCTCM